MKRIKIIAVALSMLASSQLCNISSFSCNRGAEVVSEYCDNGDVLISEAGISLASVYQAYSTQSMTVTELLRTYPNGSFYSKSGASCTCHGTSTCPTNCNCMTYYAYDSNGTSSACYQCAAFAKLCYKTFNGSDVPYHPDSAATKTVQLTTSNLNSYLNQMGTYSYVRGLTANGSPHSIFILSYTSSTVTIYHANYDKNSTGVRCNVLNETVSYSEFVKRMNKLRFYYTSGGSYVQF